MRVRTSFPGWTGTPQVWGVNANDKIYKRSGSSGAWAPVDGGLKDVSVGNGVVWGVNANDEIFKCPMPCNGSGSGSGNGWTKVDGGLKQVDAGDTEVWGVNASDAIFKRPFSGTDSDKWTKVNVQLFRWTVRRPLS